MKKVGIVMGSDSDLPVVRKAADTLEALHIPYEMHIFSAHRTPDEAAAFAANARRNGFGVLIAAAGMAAHLAGALAARTTLPVIGIPCKSSCFDGMDALLSGRHSCRYGCRERSRQCRLTVCRNTGCRRSGACRRAGRAPRTGGGGSAGKGRRSAVRHTAAGLNITVAASSRQLQHPMIESGLFTKT